MSNNTTTPVLVEERELSVTKNKGKEQIWLGASKLLNKALFQRNKSYEMTHTENGDLILDLIDEEISLKPVDGKKEDRVYTVTGKGEKPMLDLKNLPEAIKKAKKVRVVYMQGRILISVHHNESLIEERETDLVKTLDDGAKVKIGSIFSSEKMRSRLKELGLNQLANDTSCQLAIELSPSTLDAAMFDQPEFWQGESLAAVGDVTAFDFPKSNLPKLNGLLVDANMFDIRTNKAAGKKRSLSSDDDCDKLGMLLFNTFEVLKITNPAFVDVTMDIRKSEGADVEEAKNTVMTVFSSVLESLNYNVEENITVVETKLSKNKEETELVRVNLIALSTNLSREDITRSTVVGEVCDINTPVIPTFLKPASNDARIEQREGAVKDNLLSGSPLTMGSIFSGGGILDRATHEGLADMKLNSYCKFGMEWAESAFMSNLENNAAVWRNDSFFLLGDVRNVNVYLRAMTLVNGLTAGIPCVGASIAGISKNKLKNAEEHKLAGSLFVNSMEIIKASNPAFLVIENVIGYQNTVGASIIRSVLHYLGYDLFEATFKGNGYGALEDRERFVLLAVSKNICSGEHNPLNFVQPIVAKQDTLNDIKEDVPVTSTMWSWRDYLDAKQERDAAAGKGFANRQLLTGSEGKVGTIGRDYQKGRSTEPFFVFEESETYRNLYNAHLNDDLSICQMVKEAIPSADKAIMYANFAKNTMDKFNRRQRKHYKDNNLGAWENQNSQLAMFLVEQAKNWDNNSVEDGIAISMQHEIEFTREDSECTLYREFIAETLAISKATRLLTVTEHAAVKRVPSFLVDGFCATDAHKMLGNGVIFTLFQAVARQIGYELLNFASPLSVQIIDKDKCVELSIPLNEDTYWKDIDFYYEGGVYDDTHRYYFSVVQNDKTIYHINDTDLNESKELHCSANDSSFKQAA